MVVQIAADGHWDIASAYMAYRLRQADRRLAAYSSSGMSDYIAQSKYARYNEKLGRREIWTESVTRVEGMHRTFFEKKLGLRVPNASPRRPCSSRAVTWGPSSRSLRERP